MHNHSARSPKAGWKWASASILLALLCSTLRAQDPCPVEIKLLLSPASLQPAVSSLDFRKETTGRVYFFDTENLSLLAQGVIVRIRQGAKNDLTVKVRLPEGNKQVDTSNLRANFACEIDRTESGASISYSVDQKYQDARVPDTGADLFRALTPQQKDLLKEANVVINWSNVKRLTSIRSTTWKTSSNADFRKLTLEYWEYPAGSLLELSTKTAADEWESRDAALHRVVKLKGLALSASQQTKTTTVLRRSKGDGSPPQ